MASHSHHQSSPPRSGATRCYSGSPDQHDTANRSDIADRFADPAPPASSAPAFSTLA